MTDVIDFQGASGVRCRVRLRPAGADHPSAAGNYAVVRAAGGEVEVLGLGISLDLSQCRAEAMKGKGAEARRHLGGLVWTRQPEQVLLLFQDAA